MTRFLISFDEGWMTHSEEDHQDVADAARAVVQEAKDAGIWVFGGGLFDHDEMSVVDTDGKVNGAPHGKTAYVGGMSIIDVPLEKAALEWAGRIADACRCAQEVREFMPDPAVGN